MRATVRVNELVSAQQSVCTMASGAMRLEESSKFAQCEASQR
jgi:hypothetical protein